MSELLPLLREAVRKNLDRESGCVVSGGIDSSTVTMIARSFDQTIPAFTGFYRILGYDERRYATQVAGKSNWHVIEITPQDVIEVFDDVARLAPEPVQGPGMIGQYVVAQYASQYVGNVLSGEGSDELFGGYARQHMVAGLPRPKGYEHYQLPSDYPDTVEGALAYDYERLPDLLAVDDAMCNAHGLESRAPFTDPDVVEWALARDPLDRINRKAILKHAVHGLVPDAIIQRQDKMGFPIPLAYWARGPLREFFMDRIGYLPDKPYDRSWWYELVQSSRDRNLAA